MKTSELGPFWLKDNLRQARNAKARLEDAMSKTHEDSPYQQQMRMLLDAQAEVVAVWEKHVKAIEEKAKYPVA